MKKLKYLSFTLLLCTSGIVFSPSNACPSYNHVLKFLEEKVDLNKPVDNRGRYQIFEFDKNGSQVSSNSSNEDISWKEDPVEIPRIVSFSVGIGKTNGKSCTGCHQNHQNRLRYGFKDLHGNTVIKAKFKNARDFQNGMAAVQLNKRWYFINNKGKRISRSYSAVHSCSEGMAAVRLASGKWTFIDKTGKQPFARSFEHVAKFSDGLAGVHTSRGSAFINKKGEYVIQPQSNHILNFKNGKAKIGVQRSSYLMPYDYDWGVIDKTGKIIVEPRFDLLRIRNDGTSQARLTNYDSPEERSRYFDALFMTGVRLTRPPEAYAAPQNMIEATSSLDQLFTEKLKIKMKSVKRSEIKYFYDNLWVFFKVWWHLDKDEPFTRQFNAEGVVDTRAMVDKIFDAYWVKLQNSDKLSHSR